MAFDSSIVTATGGSDVGDQLAFSGDWLTTAHFGTTVRVRDTVANTYCYAVIHEVISSRLCRVGWFGSPLPVNQPTALWEEMALSAARGYPRSVCIYQQRLVFGGFRDAGSLLCMSVVGQFRNFDLGTALDSDGIAVIAAGGVRSIRHVVPEPHLTVLTENGTSYIPVDALKPLTPTTIRNQPIAPHGVANVRPAAFDGGLLMVTGSGNAVRDLAYSNTAENIQAEPVSLQATGFLGTLVDAAYLVGSTDRPEELAFFVNSAGRMMVFHSIRSQKIGSWFEWTTYGTWTAVAVAGQRLWAVVVRKPGVYALEQFDWETPFDASVTFGPAAVPATPLSLSTVPDEIYGHAVDNAGDYLGTGLIASGAFLATRQDGELPDLGTGEGKAGIAFGWWIDPLPPVVDLPDGSMLLRVQRLVRSSLKLLAAQSAVNGGEALVVRAAADEVSAAPPAITRWWTTTHLGWSRRNESDAPLVPRITRNIPMPTAVLALKREVKA